MIPIIKQITIWNDGRSYAVIEYSLGKHKTKHTPSGADKTTPATIEFETDLVMKYANDFIKLVGSQF